MASFDSTKTRLEDLLAEIKAGKLQLPDFQRGWVWDDEHIRSLLVSVARSFPIGAVMLLEAGGDTRFQVRPVEGVEPKGAKLERLILDGQQRLTSLTQVLVLDTPVDTKDEKKKAIKRFYYIDIERALAGPEALDDAIFGVDENRQIRGIFGKDVVRDLSTPEHEYKEFCFPLNRIFFADDWEQGLFTSNPSHISKYMEFRKRIPSQFKNYLVPIIELKKDNSKEAICLVFEKVNTGGVPLSVFELVTATYAADNTNLRDEWYGNKKTGKQGLSQKLTKHRLLHDIVPTDFLQGLTLLHTYEKRLKDLAEGKSGKLATGISAKREAVLSLPLAAYQKYRESLETGFITAAKFLRKEAFFSTDDLPYRTQIVPLAVVLSLLGDRWLEMKVYDKIARWFWCGVLGELYGGAVESRMAFDVPQLLAWVNGDGPEPVTVHDSTFRSGRLDTLRTRNSAAYKGISVLIARDGARDIFWKAAIRELEETDWDERRLDIHHIFPKHWCQTQKEPIPPKRFNSILNKTPISFKANRMIGGKAPSEYLKQLQDHKSVDLGNAEMDALLRSHKLDPVKLRADDFDGFVESRRALLLDEISKVMGKRATLSASEATEDEEDDAVAD